MPAQTLPRFFSVFKSESNNPERFDLVVVGPSPKFPGLTAFSAFRSTTLEYTSDPDRCDIVYQPAYDVTVKFGCKQNIYYHNSDAHQLGLTAEVTTDSVDVWLESYGHLLGFGHPDITFVEIDFETAMSEDFKMLYFKNTDDLYDKISLQTNHARPLLTESELLERSYDRNYRYCGTYGLYYYYYYSDCQYQYCHRCH